MIKSGTTTRGRASRLGLTAAAAAVVLAAQACGPATATGHAPASRAFAGAAKAPAKVTSRFFGLHAPQLATAFPGARVGAVNLTTNGVYWRDIETAPGVFDFTRLDALVTQAHLHGAQPLLVLGQTPAFHSTKPGSQQVWATVPQLAAWKTYVTKTVAHYGTRVDYEIWPEANISTNWAGTPRQLATLVSAASTIIHRAAPRAVVVSPAMVLRLPYEQRSMNAFFAQKVGGKRIGQYVDAVGIDAYPLQKGTPEDSLGLITKARHILASHHVTAPLWNVEINYGVAGGGKPIAHHSSGTKQASYVVRTYVLNAAARVKRVYWLGWARYPTMDVQMVGSDGVTTTPAGKAYSRVETWLIGQKVVSCVRDRRSHVYTCTLSRAGHRGWILWVPSGTKSVPAPASARRVQSMTGSVRATHHGKRIKVTSAPVWVYH